MVIASPERQWVIDITLFQADAGFTAYARGGIQKARLNAASIISDGIKGRPVDDATMASASLAFFDTDFTVGANKGKTRATFLLEGSILSINQEAKALTVSLGSDAGVGTNSRLTVMKNGEKLTQLRVVSVESNSCVAEFASASPDNLTKVAVGDAVLLATK